MKKRILQSLAGCFLAVAISACCDDDSTLASKDYADIEIAALKDTTVVSYSDVILEITPEVKTTYSEDQLEYAWYMYDPKEASGLDAVFENSYREYKVCEGKTLSYEVNLPSGSYVFIFEAKSKTDGYTRTTTMKVAVSTDFSRGFYILKETADGTTELDLYTREKGLNADLLSKMLGAPLEGLPANLAVTYRQVYVDESTLNTANTNMLHIFTDKDYRGLRTEDLNTIFDRSSLCFEALGDDEVPYTLGTTLMQTMFFSSKGVAATTNGGMTFSYSTGKFGMATGNGGSRYVVDLLMNLVYWNNAEHHLYSVDMNAATALPMEYDVRDLHEERLECIASGLNYMGGKATGWFVCEDNEEGTRWLYLLEEESSGFSLPPVREVRRLDASLHIASGSCVAGNALSATVIYSIHNNKLYAYNWNTGSESEITLPGIGSGETLAYVSNQFLNKSEIFDNLVVATHQNGRYKIYFYDSMVGGAPDRQTDRIAEGSGKVKSVRYVTSGSAIPGMAVKPMFPWCD